MIRHLVVALALAVGTASLVDAPPILKAKIVGVQTVGRCVDDYSAGQYKVIVTTEGWEHVWSRVYVEWLPDLSNPEAEWKPSAIADLAPPGAPGTMILDATAKPLEIGRLMIVVRATPDRDVSDLGVKKAVYTFEATTPGVSKLIDGRLV